MWQHLANAGLIEGNYTGYGGLNDSTATTASVPGGRIASCLWFVWSWGTLSSSSTHFDGTYDNTYIYGRTVPNDYAYANLIKPEEAWNIDTKIDDGKPTAGRFKTFWGGCADAVSSSSLSANYALNNSAIACTVVYPNVF